MQLERLALCVIFPPAAVIDKGANTVIIVSFFTVLGWVPGVMVAFGISLNDWYWVQQEKRQAETQTHMQASIQQRANMVNLPARYRSGQERYQVAKQAEAMRERQKQKSQK